LEEFQVELIKGVTLAEENNKKKDYKKLTKEGKKWQKAAEKDIIDREK